MSKSEILPGTYTRPAHSEIITLAGVEHTLEHDEHTYIVQVREDGKIGLTDTWAAGRKLTNRNAQPSVRWYKPNSPSLARLDNYTRVSA